jgi:hypothetical protein
MRVDLVQATPPHQGADSGDGSGPIGRVGLDERSDRDRHLHRPADRQRVLRRRGVRPDLRPALAHRAAGRGRPARARTTLKAMENVSLMMAGAQLGITACSLGLGALGEPAVAHLLQPVFEALGVPEAFVYPISFAIALSIVVYLHMVLGEMVPKNIAIAGPERSALVLGPLLYGVVTVIRPLFLLLNGIANLLLRLLGSPRPTRWPSVFTREQVATMIAESKREGLLDAGRSTCSRVPWSCTAVPPPTSWSVPNDRGARPSSAPCWTTPAPATCTRRPSRPGSRASRAGRRGSPTSRSSYVHVKDVLPVQGRARPERSPGPGSPEPRPARHLPDVQADRDAVGRAGRAGPCARRGSHLGRVVASAGRGSSGSSPWRTPWRSSSARSRTPLRPPGAVGNWRPRTDSNRRRQP